MYVISPSLSPSSRSGRNYLKNKSHPSLSSPPKSLLSTTARFAIAKQSSLMPDAADSDPDIPGNFRLMYLAHEGDVDGIRTVLAAGTNVDCADIDGRTAMHVAACQGFDGVVELLIRSGARVDPKDRWGSTPLSDAIYYKNHEVVKVLKKYGAKLQNAPMLVKNRREVPEYEIHPEELDFTNSIPITKGTFRVASWRGIKVAVKILDGEVFANDGKIEAFRDELSLLQRLRHPNVVQFLGAVTQSSPMMILTEYLQEGDLRDYLKKNGPLEPSLAVEFALDVARGMNYLHEHKPEAILHRDLEPSNILRDDFGNLKVADFGVSRSLKVNKTMRTDKPLAFQDSCRYVAPEVIHNAENDIKADIFSFALILQEMIEGHPPFFEKGDSDVPKLFAAGERPPFRAPDKLYPSGLKNLIVECWSENPFDRPTFGEVIDWLLAIQSHLDQEERWEALPFGCFQCFEAIWKEDND